MMRPYTRCSDGSGRKAPPSAGKRSNPAEAAYSRGLDGRRRASAALKSIAEPNRGALKHLTAFERHRADRGWSAGIFIAGVEDTRRAFGAVDGRTDHKAQLVDEAGSKEGAVRAAAAFDQQAFNPQLPIQNIQGQPQIEVLFASEYVGDAILA